ncbi:TraB/GumN family protein [Massilia sp. CT11-108]|uniref:TraB/GumN family protein n=1 Tax=Massilia sp. CT11-108 TaxID=3393900 RepID=UPI0039A6A173
MSKRYACALYLSFLTLPVLAQTTPEPEPAPTAAEAFDTVPATVVVEGRRPGPGVWKVSKGDHVMWVFGVYSPLPQKMEWDAARVERLVGKSQEVLTRPGARMEVGFFRGLTLLPTAIGIDKNPDGATLHDVLPADVYARWQVLKGKYIGDDDGIERRRPIFVADTLLSKGLSKSGLTQNTGVEEQIEKAARHNKVKITSTTLSMDVDDPRALMKEFKKSQVEDVACFTKTLDRLEGDIDAMRVRANAWANGNIAEMSSLDYAERDKACNDAIFNSQFAKNSPAFQHLPERIRANWMKAAEKALADNTSTFALLPMKNVIGPQSYLADLQAQGYTVESPK